MRFFAFVKSILIITSLSFVLTACGERLSSHGHIIDEHELKDIEINKTTKADILLTLGKPSFEGAFNSGKVYYVAQTMIQPAGGSKTTTDRELFIFTFDENNILQVIEVKDETTGISIAKLDAKTPTPGNNFGVIEQIFANIRRRNANE